MQSLRWSILITSMVCAAALAAGAAGEEPIRVILLGHDDHGQALLAASLAGGGTGEGAAAPAEERVLGLPISLREIELATASRRYVLTEFARSEDVVKALVGGVVEADGAILMVSAADGPMPQTREHVLLARQVGVPAIVVYLGHTDRVDDEELLDLVELEVRELLSAYGFDGDGATIVRPATASSAAAGPGGSRDAIAELKAALDRSIPAPKPANEADFLMPVEDVFSIAGRGTVVTGRIERGHVAVGNTVAIIGLRDTSTTTVTGIEMFRRTMDEGQAGDNVGILLRGIKKDEVERGQVLAKPGTIRPHTRFRGEVYMLAKEEGGRHTPFFDGYRPQLYFRTIDVTGVAHLPEGTEMAMPGGRIGMEVELITPIALEKGVRFAVREGGRTVGVGIVTEILE
jgi:elongation factor Tu